MLLGSLMRPFVLAQPPMQTQCITLDGRPFYVEIATTAEQRQRGLQFREALAANQGMLFSFHRPQPLSFWMKDCKIALDLLFFRRGVLVDYVDAAPPCRAQKTCPIYTSKASADTVVELNAGTRRNNGLGLNTRLSNCVAPMSRSAP